MIEDRCVEFYTLNIFALFLKVFYCIRILHKRPFKTTICAQRNLHYEELFIYINILYQ